ERPNAFTDRLDVLRRGAATPAEYLRPGMNQVPRVRRHVFRTRHVHAAAAHVTRHSRVRLSAQLPSRHRYHLLDALEDDLRTNRAIEPDDVGAPTVQRSRDVLRRRS